MQHPYRSEPRLVPIWMVAAVARSPISRAWKRSRRGVTKWYQSLGLKYFPLDLKKLYIWNIYLLDNNGSWIVHLLVLELEYIPSSRIFYMNFIVVLNVLFLLDDWRKLQDPYYNTIRNDPRDHPFPSPNDWAITINNYNKDTIW